MLDRCRGVDDDAVLRDVPLCVVPSDDERAFRRRPATPHLVRSIVEPALQRGKVHFEDKDAVEQIDELREVPRATAEERHRLALVGGQGPDPLHIPDVVLVRGALDGITGLRVPPVGQLAVAVDGVVTAPLQLRRYSPERRTRVT